MKSAKFNNRRRMSVMLIGPYVDSSAAHGPTHRFAAAGILLACLIGLLACANPAAHSPKSSNGTSSLSVSIAPQASRAIVAGSTDYFGAIKAYKVTVSDASNSYTSTTVSAGTCTIEGIAVAADYAVAVQAYSDTGSTTQIASGSASSVVVTAGNTTTVPITLSFTQTASSGGYNLKVAWPASTALPYVCTRLDSTTAAYTAVQGTSDSTNYTATISASSLSGGAHQLYIYFAASSSSSTLFGPYLELLDIWDGVTDSMWADPSGALHDTLSLAPAEFSSSDATLANLSVTSVGLNTSFAPTTYSYSFGTGFAVGTSYPFTITTQSASQGVSCTFNGADSPLTATSSTTLTGTFTAVSGANTIIVSVTAADRKTSQSYTVTVVTIASTADLASMATNLSGYYALTADIDTTSAGSWTPIGGATSTPFTGTFDGYGHTVTYSTTSSTTTGAGFFYSVGSSGVVENLGVAGTLTANTATAAGGIAGSSSGQITGCTSAVTITANAASFTGGIVGNASGTISDCVSTGDVTGFYHTGGIIGTNQGASISRCHSTGAIKGQYGVGGIVGEWQSGTFDQCYALGDVGTAPPTATNSGGLIGDVTTAAAHNCTNCYARGNVSGSSSVGGFIGGTFSPPVNASFTNCYCTGTPTATFVGSASSFTYNSSCYSVTVQTGVTAALPIGTLPTGFSAAIWGVDATAVINNGYPYLLFP
jgi:hypothetical protein